MKKFLLLLTMIMAVTTKLLAIAAPTGLTAVTVTSNYANLTWSAVTSAANYNVFMNSTKVASVSKNSMQLTGLLNGAQYIIGVQAVDLFGNTSSVSASVTFTAGVNPGGQTTNVYCVNCATSGGGGSASYVTVGSSVLPSGASTSALQTTGNTSLGVIAGAISSTSGTPFYVSPVSSGLFGGGALSAGTNFIGSVNISNTASSPVLISPSATGLFGGSLAAGTNYIGAVGISGTALKGVTVNAHALTGGVTYIGAVGVSIPAGTSISVSLPTYTSANPLPVGATITALAAGLQTASGGTSGMNVAVAFDYDANTSTATTKRLAPTLTTYQSTSGTATIYGSGYTLITSITVFPATVAGSRVTFYDSTVTKTTISTLAAGFYQFPRGLSFGTSCVMVITGAAFDGAVSVETLR